MQAFPGTARSAVQALRASKIRAVANAGMGREDIAAFWFGEPDEVTPEFIRRAAADALHAGDTFYTQNLGIPELRDAVAGYLTRLHRDTSADDVAITNSGMSALMLVAQALVGHGDRVVAVTPLWPNLVEIPKILGAEVETVALTFTSAGWVLDLDRLKRALTPDTRAVFINSPNNPTGWTIDRSSQQTILEHCRRHGIWIVADDAYERLVYNGVTSDKPAGETMLPLPTRPIPTLPVSALPVAPSFLDIATAEERVVSTNTFSKTWLMTGFRLGWIVAPRSLVPDLSKLIEYNTSCAPPFVQRAGVVAVQQGDGVIAHTVARFKQARDFLVEQLNQTPGVEVALPAGAMYAFLRIEGVQDSLAFCQRLIAVAGLGLAPGIAFGPEGEGFVRWCFAASEERLADGIQRLRSALGVSAVHRRLRIEHG